MGPKLSKMGPKLSKMGPKLSKTVIFTGKTQSNGRVNPPVQYKPAWDLKQRCILYP